ncbi:MAG: 50S ribosomal protein L24 [Planctomycetes bacterium]|jgi:large subunit ribosomal protein L24|nr:50S ribosomal protein L24 [Planctomycetota bacterium]
MKIKKGDKVKMLAGKDKGKNGKVLQVFPKEGRVSVEGLNVLIKHLRPRRQGEKGQRLEFPGSVNISNVAILCSKCGKQTRVAYKIEGDKKHRICKKCGESIS